MPKNTVDTEDYVKYFPVKDYHTFTVKISIAQNINLKYHKNNKFITDKVKRYNTKLIVLWGN